METPGAGFTTTKYAVDGWNPALQGGTGNTNFNDFAVLNANNTLQTRNLFGDQVDEILARVNVSGGSGTAFWDVTDKLGSIRDVLNGSGAVVDAINYDAYGNITSQTHASDLGMYGWTGQQKDIETGLQYNQARWYDSSTGRWISQDPLGFDAGDSNLYRYVNNAPTDGTDPSVESEAYITTFAGQFLLMQKFFRESSPHLEIGWVPDFGINANPRVFRTVGGISFDAPIGLVQSEASGLFSGAGTADQWNQWFVDHGQPDSKQWWEFFSQGVLNVGTKDAKDAYFKIQGNNEAWVKWMADFKGTYERVNTSIVRVASAQDFVQKLTVGKNPSFPNSAKGKIVLIDGTDHGTRSTYNCYAWVLNDKNSNEKIPGNKTYEDKGYKLIQQAPNIDVTKLSKTKDYIVLYGGEINNEFGGTDWAARHAAKKDRGNDLWSSKLGGNALIGHETLSQLEDGLYGKIFKIYERE